MTHDEPSAQPGDHEGPGYEQSAYQQSAPDPYAPPYQREPYGQHNSYQPQPYGQPSYGQQPYGQQPGSVQQPYPMPVQQPLSEADARLWSMLSHIGLAVTGFVAPLIIWAVLKERSPLVRQNAAAATNFGFLMTIGYIVGAILLVVVIGSLVFVAAAVLSIIFGIIGAIRANNGEVYAYPFNVKWIR